MAREQEIAAQIGSLHELREIVAAIRAMAAVQMQQSQRSLDAVRDYIEIIQRALAEAAALMPEDRDGSARPAPARPGLVVFCAEHGFCGAFDEALIAAASQERRRQANLYLIFVGARGAQRSLERGLRPDLTLPMATHSGGVTAAARRAAAAVYRLFLANSVDRVDVLYMRTTAERRTMLQKLGIMPLETPPAQRRAAAPPLINLQPRRLLEELASEYMFAMLEAAAMESFASENAARFRTMEAAYDNIENKSAGLARLLRRMRQEAVTAEILELIGGFEAMESQ